jgi:3-oxoacyl-[acyl-carrier protein] reductase
MSGSTKVALVTGGARGIGRGCALALARAGCDIVLVDLLESELARTVGEIATLGRRAMPFVADVAEHGRAKEVVAAVLAEWGRIDVLISNAGKPMAKGILEISEEEFDRTLGIHLKGAFNYVQAAAPAMLAQGGGRIVLMSSMNAHSGGVTAAVSRFAYASAKAGLLGMTRALAKELGPSILVNAICPGLIETEIPKNHVIVERGAEIAAKGIALRRVGKVEDVASLATYLAMAEPCFITGQDINVDGFQYNV